MLGVWARFVSLVGGCLGKRLVVGGLLRSSFEEAYR